jgi:hypothetical protein
VNGKLRKPCKKCKLEKIKEWKKSDSGKSSIRQIKKRYREKLLGPNKIDREKKKIEKEVFLKEKEIRRNERQQKRDERIRKKQQIEERKNIRLQVLKKREHKKYLKSLGKKHCNKCKEYKDKSEFFNNVSRKDGVTGYCKVCQKKNYELKVPSEITQSERVCKKCGILKESKKFGRTKWGLQSWCRNCQTEKNLEVFHSHTKEQRMKYNKSVNELHIKKYNSDEVYRTHQLVSRHVLMYLKKNGSKKNNKVETLLEYRISTLIDTIGLRPSKKSHLDHKIPVSWFNKDCPISLIWDIRNLWWVTSKYNTKKGNRWCDIIPEDYLEVIRPYLERDLVFERDVNS